MDRDDGRAGQPQRECVLEVAEVGAEPAKKTRQHDCHSELLRRGRELHRLDPGWDELRVARDRGEAEAGFGGERRERAQQVQDIGLVAGAAAAEHVRVDRDQLHAISFHAATVASATPSQV